MSTNHAACISALLCILVACGQSAATPAPTPPTWGSTDATSTPGAFTGDASVAPAQRDAGPSGGDVSTDASVDHAPDAASAPPPPSCDNPPPPPIDPSFLPKCPKCSGDARCVPRSIVEQAAGKQIDLFAKCGKDDVCVPDAVIESGGYYRATSCASWNQAEGRCLSECLPQVASQRDRLPQDVCAKGERCVPCFDPIDGEPTGACGISCDPGPADPTPHTFDTCCGGDGLCLPGALVPAAQKAELGRDTCDGTDAFCAPSIFVDDDARPSSCRSIADAEGRCLPTCLPAVNAQRSDLPQSTCKKSERCVPCFDPIKGGDTGACNLHGDAPSEPPVRFDSECCGDHGLCVPKDLAGKNAKSLPVDSCDDDRGAGWVCAPRQVVEDPSTADDPFASCRVKAAFVTVYRGKCVPRCMISQSVLSRALAKGNCDSGELCVPCAVAGDLPGC